MNLFRFLFAFCVLTTAARAYFDISVTGSTTGAAYGTDIYTTNSDLGTAAVHAGLIGSGQTATIRVYITSREMEFNGSTRNGVTTQSYGMDGSGFILTAVPPAGAQPPGVRLNLPPTILGGRSFYVTTDAFDPNSNLSTVKLNRSGTGIINSTTWASGDSYALETFVTAPTSPTTIQFRGEITDTAGASTLGSWNTVTVVSSSTNLAPKAWIYGPTTLVAGEAGTWTYESSDANANLSSWSLTQNGNTLMQANISGGSQTSSYPYTFITPGTYTLTISAQDSNGLSGSGTLNITVISPPNNYIDYGYMGGVSCYPDNSSMHSYVWPDLAHSYRNLNDGSHVNEKGYGSVSGTNWLRADFGSPKKVLRVYTGGGHLMGWGLPAGNTRNSTLQYSSDNTNWTIAHTYAAGFAASGTSVDIGAPGVGITARYWRLHRTNWMGTTEFRFEGDPTPYILTVQNGEGSVSGITANSPRPILANAPPAPNYLFSHWTLIAGVGSFYDANSAATNFLMGTGDATVSAIYVPNVAPQATITGPATLLVGQQGTWTKTANDSNQNLKHWKVTLLSPSGTPLDISDEDISGGSQSVPFNYTLSAPGTYTFRLEVTDLFDATATQDAVVQVQAPPAFTTQPQNQGGVPGGSATFSIAATGNPTPTYQWERKAVGGAVFTALSNGGDYSGVNTATLGVANLTLAMTGDQFRCVATNSIGSATSAVAVLGPVFKILEHLETREIAAGG